MSQMRTDPLAEATEVDMSDAVPVAVEGLALLCTLRGDKPVLHVARDERVGADLAEFLATMLPGRRILFFPPWDCLPFDGASPTPDAMGRRMAVLQALRDPRPGDVLIAPLSAFLQRLPPKDAVRCFEINQGQTLDIAALEDFLRDAGYVADDRVDEPGEFIFRGGTVEIYSGGDTYPCRIEFDEGTVAALRHFDPVSQRSLAETDRLQIVPVTELPASDAEWKRGSEHRLPECWDSLTALSDHMPDARITAMPATLAAAKRRHARLEEAWREAKADGAFPLSFDALYIAECAAQELPVPEWEQIPTFAAAGRPRARLAKFLAEVVGNRRVVFIAGSEKERARLTRMVDQADRKPPVDAAGWDAAQDHDRSILIADLAEGAMTSDIALITAQDMIGSRAGVQSAHVAVVQALPPSGLDLGDIVVHEEHGLARLEGLEPLDADSPGAEAIRLTFAGDERLLVPARDAGRIWRYGTGEAGVKLDRLRAAGWETRRAATEDALVTLADHIVALTRARDAKTAPKLVPPVRDYERFIASFPFQPTPDQAEAVQAALRDMGSGKPMDRLLIGDVGFGKTEIALRAAAAAALNGHQVAICAPTTVLARQHYETFRRRFAPLGIEVAHLWRLVSGKPAATRAGLADGTIRVAVGTHALLGKGVSFVDLRLLIIDEEQRFGSVQKQKLRSLGKDIHVLSMSATPIPRTLQTALAGLQDLSFLHTPPARRRPIRTEIAEDEDVTLKRALLREVRRGGQSFVVVPRVEDIAPVATRLGSLLPDLRLRIAHGDLPVSKIDEAMVGFAAGDGDVLLATAIIESGLDVARANTMIILRPALFGLAQLHQLRGRVGRGPAQAYCHLLTAKGEDMPEEVRRRLKTLQTMDRLGAGLAISTADLDRRGAGDLLGDKQAGHVQKIGLGLYQDMLAQALRRAKGEPDAPPQTDVPGEPGHIPVDHIPEPETRIDLYHRIARAACAADVDRLADEIADRFGPPPKAIETLLQAARVRAMAGQLGIARLSVGPAGVSFEFRNPNEAKEVSKALSSIEGLSLAEGCLTLQNDSPDDRLEIAATLLERMA